jgi:hypothetical protein
VFNRAPDAPPGWLPDWLRPQADRTRVTPAPDQTTESKGEPDLARST